MARRSPGSWVNAPVGDRARLHPNEGIVHKCYACFGFGYVFYYAETGQEFMPSWRIGGVPPGGLKVVCMQCLGTRVFIPHRDGWRAETEPGWKHSAIHGSDLEHYKDPDFTHGWCYHPGPTRRSKGQWELR